MTTLQLIQYYANLLIIQYLNLPRAYATVQADITPVIMPMSSMVAITFYPFPDSGVLRLQYNFDPFHPSGPINWNDNASAFQAALRQIPGLENITVSGAINSTIIVTFAPGTGFPKVLTLFSNSFKNGVVASIMEIHPVTPLLLTFSDIPTSGDYSFTFESVPSSIPIPYNANAAAIQENIIANFPRLTGISVVGNATDGFIIYYNTISLLTIGTNTLMIGSNPVYLNLSVLDQTLPIAVQNGYALDTAVGKQLDIIGKYIGVTRTSNTSIGNITLRDSDYITFLKFAIIQNSSGSSLADIEFNMNLIFPGQFLIFDYKTMNMSYILSSTLGSAEFFAVLLQENLLPRPMAVGISVIVTPVVTNFFGFNTQFRPHPNNKPLNRYSAFDTTWRFLSYANGVFV